MRERLIKLLKQAEKQQILNAVCGDIDSLIDSPRGAEFIADYLIENGVVLLPCKVGEKVFTGCTRGINDKFIQESTVSKIVLDDWDGLRIIKKVVDERGCCFFYDVDQEQLNKTTFFSKEEAERALRKEDEGK